MALIDLVAFLNASDPGSLRLRRFGLGRLEGGLRRQVARTVPDCTEFVGTFVEDGLMELLRRRGLSVLPSGGETLPTVNLQTMDTEVPVVAVHAEDVSDVIPPDLGWLVACADPDLLANAVRQVCSNSVQAGVVVGQAGQHISQMWGIKAVTDGNLTAPSSAGGSDGWGMNSVEISKRRKASRSIRGFRLTPGTSPCRRGQTVLGLWSFRVDRFTTPMGVGGNGGLR